MQTNSLETVSASGTTAARLGFWSAIATTVCAAIALGIGVTTTPMSGPNCLADCATYPYRDVAAYVPHDYIWLYPAMLMMIAFVILIGALHSTTPLAKRAYSQVALSFATISAALLLADYYIQVAVMQPSILRGEFEGIALLTQYNPHGVFIALEDMGYFLMAVTFVFAAFVFSGGKGIERALYWLLLVGGAAAVFAYFAYYGIYGTHLEYRYEVTAIAVNWLNLIVTGVLLAIWFRRHVPATAH